MRKILLFCFFLFFSLKSNAQEPALKIFNTKNGLQGTSFREIVQGKKGNLWIASDQGVTKYNGYSFLNFSSDEGLFDEQIASVKPITKGDIVAISKKGNLFKLQNDSVIPFENNRMLSRLVSHTNEISSMAVDKGDTIWLGLNNANYYIKLVPVAGSYAIKKIEIKYKAHIGLINRQFFYSINRQCKNNTINVSGSGINFHFDFNEPIKHISAYSYNKETIVSCNEYLFKGSDLNPHKLYDNINQLYIDDEDNIWLLFENLGLGYSKSSKPQDVSIKIKNVDFLSFYRDYEGGSWLGSYDKGLYYIPTFNVFSVASRDGLTDDVVTSLYKDKKNRILAGSTNGNLFVIENYKAKLIANFNLTSVTQNQINCIYQSSDNYYWVACLHSSYRISNDFKEIIELKHHGKRLQNIHSFLESNNGLIWAGGEDELYSINNEPNHITFNDYDVHFKINAIAIDNRNELWLGCNNGLWKFNQRFFKYYGFNNRWLKGKITDLMFDKNKVLWVATHNMGLLKIENNNIKHYTRFNGLISNFINKINLTSDNYPLIATNNGLSVFNKASIINYNTKNGLSANNCIDVLSFNNEIWLSTTKGISIIKQILTEKKPIKLITHVNKIYINDKLQFPENKKIILEHFQNNIEIYFNAASFKNNGKTRYRYLLKGLNDHWRTTINNNVRFPELNDGEYELIIQAENSEGIWGNDTAQLNFKIKTPFYEQWWFIFSALFIVAFFSGWFVRWRLKKFHFKELRQAELRRRLIDLELQALRSQMNPHFIFNSINSIQHFVVNNNSTEAQRYLSKFAKLMRNVLDNSKTSHIPLEKELQTLELYMQLESLRFDEHFEFEIKIDPSIDVGYTEIPSMLIQPYIENAIWHGLMHKQGKGKILVELSRIDEKQIKCVIEDNGIGREKAIEYKSKNKIAHKSVGMMITKERLQILNKINESDLSIKITDLKDENQKPLGTRVEIFVPIN